MESQQIRSSFLEVRDIILGFFNLNDASGVRLESAKSRTIRWQSRKLLVCLRKHLITGAPIVKLLTKWLF